jgi:hypothetical protein
VFGDPALASYGYAVAVSGRTVYVGGGFFYSFAGMASETYNRIAMWDGRAWNQLGTGLNGAVHAIAVVGTDVYVGGEFTVAGDVVAQRLARWDGTSWSAVAGGITDPDRSYGTTVQALASDGKRLYVGGVFTQAGTVPARSLAALDLESGEWSAIGDGVWASYTTEPAEVRDLLLVDGTLYVGGGFDRAGETEASALAALDTDTDDWTWFGQVLDEDYGGTVHALARDDASGAIYVGGRFTDAGGTRAWNVARLRDGRFEAIGDASFYGGKYATIAALAWSGGKLYAGGTFTDIGAAAVPHWAVYDGHEWSQPPGAGLDNVVTALAPHGEAGVVVLGDFGWSGDVRIPHGGIWNGTGWETFGQGVTSDPHGGGEVLAISPVGNGAYVGGLFDQAGQLRVGSIARWTGSEWDTMAGGVGVAISHGRVFAMEQIGADLYVAGSFTTAGGVACNNIARWDGTAWHPLGEGLDGNAYALTVLGGRLYVGGGFNVAGRERVGRLACWDPATETWSRVGNAPVYDHNIYALAPIYDRYLVIGGVFHRWFHQNVTIVEGLSGMALFDTQRELDDRVLAGYLPIHGVSRWGAPGWVNALEVIGEDLYVGGWFNVAGIMSVAEPTSAGFPVGNLAVWHFGTDGTWESPGDADDHVDALTSVGGHLVATGSFRTVGPTAANHIARFDPGGRTWHALGSGLSGEGDDVQAKSLALGPESGLWVGGWFAAAGRRPSANLALWTATQGQGP